jgi:DNA relaxase NicK
LTASTSERETGIDWISLTISKAYFEKVGCDPKRLLWDLRLPSDDYEKLEKGLIGWKQSAAFAGGVAKVAWDGQRGTAFISLPASAIAYLVQNYDFDWKFFLRWAAAKKIDGMPAVAFRRLDLFIDDKTGQTTVAMYINAVRRRDIRTHIQKFVEESDVVGPPDRMPGAMLKCGVRGGGSTYVRVYDKLAEQYNALMNRGRSVADLPGAWVRLEAEFTSDRADAVTRSLIAHRFSGSYIVALIRQVIDFTDSDDQDKNVSRRRLASWWASLVGDAPRAEVRVPDKPRDIMDVMFWLDQQVKTSLGLMLDVFGLETIVHLASSGLEEMGIRQLRLKQEYMAAA